MTTLGQDLRRARAAARMSIRALAEAAGVSTSTILRIEQDGGDVSPRTLDKLTTALGVGPARMDERGVWRIDSRNGGEDAENPQTSTSRTIVTDSGAVLTLRVPPGFLENLTVEQRAELEADALLAVMRMAREVRRNGGHEAS